MVGVPHGVVVWSQPKGSSNKANSEKIEFLFFKLRLLTSDARLHTRALCVLYSIFAYVGVLGLKLREELGGKL